MSIVKFNPLNDVVALQNQINRVFGDLFPNPNGKENARLWSPAVDVHEGSDSFTIEVELPGMKKDDVTLKYQDGTLSISGERKQEKETGERNSHRSERVYGKFSRSFHFPTSVNGDSIRASFSDGVLTVNIPKADEAKPRQIEIS